MPPVGRGRSRPVESPAPDVGTEREPLAHYNGPRLQENAERGAFGAPLFMRRPRSRRRTIPRGEVMEAQDIVWQGKVGSTPLKVAVPHSELIIAEWVTPQGNRQKVSETVEEFERSVLLQLLLGAGASDASETEEVVAAVRTAQAERPRPAPPPQPRRRKNPKARRHRRSRRPPRR